MAVKNNWTRDREVTESGWASANRWPLNLIYGCSCDPKQLVSFFDSGFFSGQHRANEGKSQGQVQRLVDKLNWSRTKKTKQLWTFLFCHSGGGLYVTLWFSLTSRNFVNESWVIYASYLLWAFVFDLALCAVEFNSP